MKSLLDPSFRYVPASRSDIQKTFDRIRREQRAAAESERLAAEERLRNVVSEIKGRKTA